MASDTAPTCEIISLQQNEDFQLVDSSGSCGESVCGTPPAGYETRPSAKMEKPNRLRLKRNANILYGSLKKPAFNSLWSPIRPEFSEITPLLPADSYIENDWQPAARNPGKPPADDLSSTTAPLKPTYWVWGADGIPLQMPGEVSEEELRVNFTAPLLQPSAQHTALHPQVLKLCQICGSVPPPPPPP